MRRLKLGSKQKTRVKPAVFTAGFVNLAFKAFLKVFRTDFANLVLKRFLKPFVQTLRIQFLKLL